MSPRRDEFDGSHQDPLKESSGSEPEVPPLAAPHREHDAHGNARWTIHTPAKINLFLKILGRRPDGFHAIETLMAPVSLFDTLTFSLPKTSGPKNQSDGAIGLEVIDCRTDTGRTDSGTTSTRSSAAPQGEENLVVRALRLLQSVQQAKRGPQQAANITLYKRIPSEAGLGGGSSDAAAALLLGNAAWGLNLSYAQLSELAGQLGSDVPFFLTPGAAYCTGRGELIRPVDLPGALAGVIAKPPVGLSTPEIFRRLNAPEVKPPEHAAAIKRNSLGEQSSWELAQDYWHGDHHQESIDSNAGNDLQPPAEEATPWIGQLKQAFGALPFYRHQMSGSGSAYFGLCRSQRLAQRLASVLRQQGWGWVQAISTC